MRLRTIVPTLMLIAAPAAPLAAQTAPETPEAVAQRYVDAMRRHDWAAMAQLMHPQAVAKFRTMMGALMRSQKAGRFREQFFGDSSAAQLDSLSDRDFYARFLEAAMSEAELQEIVDSAQVTILGHVNESPEIVHVVFSMRLPVGPISVVKPDVITLRREGTGWLALLRADIEIMAAALQQRFGT